jgi:hypothetical protein
LPWCSSWAWARLQRRPRPLRPPAALPGGPSGIQWAPEACTQLLQDGSFEAGTPSLVWEEFSTNFGTPLCDATCGTGGGTAGPRTGSWWAWFGGSGSPETGYVSQTITITTGVARLGFYLWIGTTGAVQTDFLQVRIDNTAIFTATEDQQPLYPTYTQVELNVDAYANGQPHVVQFYSDSATQGTVSNFNLDDVTLCATAPTSVSLTAIDAAPAENYAWLPATLAAAVLALCAGAWALRQRARSA